MNNPFDYTPDSACDEAFRALIARLDELKRSDCPEDVNFCRELESGKMLGVLIATDNSGAYQTLYAFSGQLGNGGFHYRDFVGPVFDYLRPEGYFKLGEADISRRNREIDSFEKDFLPAIRSKFEDEAAKLEARVREFKEKCRVSKINRDSLRESGTLTEGEQAELVRQSQFEKAELHRLKKRVAAELKPFEEELKNAQTVLESMKEERRTASEALQNRLFSDFRLLNARGESKSLSEIFADTAMKIPPSGAGECCAPKLLHAAYLRGLHPVSIAEYWYGKPKEGEVRIHGTHYPACRGKCLPVLGWMLQGLDIYPPLESSCRKSAAEEPEIIFENEWFCVVNKPPGMLSAPGKGNEISVQQWLAEKYGNDRDVRVAHRLDQDTSGLLVATFGNKAYRTMQQLFATRKVRKRYVAVLEGNYESSGIARKGTISLPLSPDLLDRPRQRVDIENGKEAVTDYEFLEINDGRSRIAFYPHTGRTHQLRVHAASDSGLGMPIAGDPLYGLRGNGRNARMTLHAQKIEFTFPEDNRLYSFECPVTF